jgi:uncharacterized protein (DUF488 family)
MGTVYTAGHGLLPLEALIINLHTHDIELVVDVRSHPGSTRAPQFNRDPLRDSLHAVRIDYSWMGEALGGRPPERLRTATGAPDYERMAAEAATVDALDRLADMASGSRIALLCSESRPEGCHRTRMLEPQLEIRGTAVEHILPDGSLVARPTLFL